MKNERENKEFEQGKFFITDKVSRLWCISNKDKNEVVKFKELDIFDTFVYYDPSNGCAYDEHGHKKIQLFQSFRYAKIRVLKNTVAEKKKKWDDYISKSMALNDEIGVILGQIEKLEEFDEIPHKSK